MSIANLFYPNKYDLFCKSITIEGNHDETGYINVYELLSDAQKADVKDRTALLDLTATVNAIIANNQKKLLYFRDGTWRFDGTLNCAYEVSMYGAGWGATTFYWNNTNLNCIEVHGLVSLYTYFFQLKNINFTFSPTKVAGLTIDLEYAANALIDNVQFSGAVDGIRLFSVNTVIISNIYANNMVGGAGTSFLKIQGSTNLTGPVNIVKVYNCVCNLDYLGGDGIVIDDYVSNCSFYNCNILQANVGILCKTLAPAPTAFPRNNVFNNIRVNGARTRSVQIDAGHGYKFTECNFFNNTGDVGQLSNDFEAVRINPDLAGSVVQSVKILNSSIGFSKLDAVFSDCEDFLLSGCDIKPNAGTLAGAFGIKLGANSKDSLITNNRVNTSTAPYYDYAFGTDFGTLSFICDNNDFRNCNVKETNILAATRTGYAGNNVGSKFGVTSNNNGYQELSFIDCSTSIGNMTAAELNGKIIYLLGGPGAPITLNLPTAALTVDYLESPSFRKALDILFVNSTNQPATISLSVGWTSYFSKPTGHIPANESRMFKVLFTSVEPGAQAALIIG